MGKKVSVIIPVYNVRDYLDEAVNSAVSQTYRNLEIILVDDGSTDGSGRLCDAWKEKDSRIIVIHDRNEGLSEARNRGIRIASGEYICFLDSDDYYDTAFVEKLLSCMEATGADLAICPAWKLYPDGAKTGPDPEQRYVELDTDEVFKLLFTHSGHIGLYAWNKMYRASLFADIRFPYGKYFEDSGTTYKIVDRSRKNVYCPEPLYYYRVQRPDSIVMDKSKMNRRLDKCDFLEEMDAFFRARDRQVYDAFAAKYLTDLMEILEDCLMQSAVDSEVWRRAKGMFRKHSGSIIANQYLPAGRKIKGISLLFGNGFFRLFCGLKKWLFSRTSCRGYEV